jgi:membrane protein
MSLSTQQDPAPGAVPPPIPGEPVDPPPKQLEKTLRKVDTRGDAAGSAYRAFLRYSHTNASLLAAGTTYYIFLAVFSILVFAFGLAALIGGQALADTVTQSANEAFPGLIGDQGISTSDLEQVGQTTSVIGLLALLFSGSGAMVAASNSLHLIYGAPKDPRNFVLSRARLLAWMLLIVPLIGLSFVPSVVIGNFAQPVMDWLGLEGGFWTFVLFALTAAASILLNGLVVWLMLGHLGGIKPARRPRLIGAALGAVGIEILKYLLSFIISWSVGKPQYGAFAAPIAMLLVLYLETLVVYVSACLTAGIAVATGDPHPEPDLLDPVPA